MKGATAHSFAKKKARYAQPGLQTMPEVAAKTYAHNPSWAVKGVDCSTEAADGLVVYQAGETACIDFAPGDAHCI